MKYKSLAFLIFLFLIPISALAASLHCPSIPAIKSIGIQTVESLSNPWNLWMGTAISQYDTNQKWEFDVFFLHADQATNENEAKKKMNTRIQKISDVFELGNGCFYLDDAGEVGVATVK